jgi:copper(I)-binding protein
MRPALLLGIALAGAAGACRPGLPAASATLGDLRITDGFAYEPIIPASGAAYLAITNTGTAADTLESAASPDAADAMFHGGAMTAMGVVPIPPGTHIVFEPGGAHIMLMEFSKLPKAGDSLPLTLTFTHAGSIALKLPVRRHQPE